MKKILIMSCLFLSLPLIGCYSQQEKTEAENKDKVKVEVEDKAKDNDRYIWDFGRVGKNTELKHTFVLTNNSGKNLNIKDVRTSCGCTTARAKNTALLPQEATELETSVKTGSNPGQITQYVYITTDNLDNPVLRFIIKAYVEE